MEQPEKELIKEIANLFEDYEEAYVPGEWEAFSNKRKKKYPFLPNALKIAAVLILGFGSLPFLVPDIFKPADQPVVLSVSKPAVQAGENIRKQNKLPLTPAVTKNSPLALSKVFATETKVQNSALNHEHSLNFERNDELLNASVKESAAPLQSAPEVALATRSIDGELKSAGSDNPVQQNRSILSERLVTAQIKESTVPNATIEKISTMDFLASESKQTKNLVAKEQISKWDFGLALAPSMTSSNMNIGGGLTTAYRLSDKFAISSGVSLLQLQSAINVTPTTQSKMAVTALSSKELLAIDANIKAIDIPVAIVYNFNKNFYTSAGLSYFNVISEKRNNTYEQASATVQSSADPATGFTSDIRTVVSQTLSEPVQESRLKGNSYLGFFNFSVGRKQNIFNKYNVLIEPFIKIPVGKLSAEDLRLTNSGLKFQFSF
jgi:hypothetical protein